MVYLITGGTGFVGSYIAKALINRGDKVIAYDYLPSNVMQQILTPEEISQLTVAIGNINDLARICKLIKEHKVDKIIHLAFLLHPYCDQFPDEAVQVNIAGQSTILEAMRIMDVQKLVYASSCVVYGNQSSHDQLVLDNDAKHAPVSIYGATKSFNEFLTNHYAQTWNLDVIGLRYTLVYGPGRVRGATAFINALTEPALGKKAVVPFGDDVVDWQYVEDIAALTVKASDVGPTKTKHFNTRFDVRSIREAGEFVKKLIPDAEIEYQPGTFGLAWQLDDTLLQQEIGFKPQVSMEQGLKNLINFIRRVHQLPEFK
ncbi:MAG: nucleoside-diphosphate-sugar epimerase [Paenibacillaceae bacterium]|jgi:nucleoside-diphosphate-sugar epimerase|nr:nucleoside-diphosphate-sugar epimerase [Paenibacillaceae bacterium]